MFAHLSPPSVYREAGIKNIYPKGYLVKPCACDQRCPELYFEHLDEALALIKEVMQNPTGD
jgi:hypothetical protein